jgi:CheY-like chemotaxis protein
MNPPSRPRPKVLFVHNGSPYDAQIRHLTGAGLRVTETHLDTALVQALRLQPDIIVLDFGCDGVVTAQIKGDTRTRDIPVIALIELTRPR